MIIYTNFTEKTRLLCIIAASTNFLLERKELIMGIFQSADEKAAKQDEKLNDVMKKYGLEKLSGEYRDEVAEINSELLGSKALEVGMKISMAGKTEEILKVSYLKAILEQNWIIIRLLNDLNSK